MIIKTGEVFLWPSRVALVSQAALLKYAEDAVAESRALRSSRAGVSKKELFDSVRRELECAPCLCYLCSFPRRIFA